MNQHIESVILQFDIPDGAWTAEPYGNGHINQIVGYILSEDPTYITNHNSARTLICKVDRDELLQALVKNYLDID